MTIRTVTHQRRRNDFEKGWIHAGSQQGGSHPIEGRAAGASETAGKRFSGLQEHGLRPRQLLPLQGAVRHGRRGSPAGTHASQADHQEPRGEAVEQAVLEATTTIVSRRTSQRVCRCSSKVSPLPARFVPWAAKREQDARFTLPRWRRIVPPRAIARDTSCVSPGRRSISLRRDIDARCS